MNTDNAQYTLIYYRPNGSKYLGCGDYDNFDSEIGFENELSFEKLRLRIIEHTKRADCCDGCSNNDNPTELAILRDGKVLLARGDAMWSFASAIEETEETFALEELLSEANIRSEKEKLERIERERKEREEKEKLARERAERDRYEQALKTLGELSEKHAGPRVGSLTAGRERELLKTLKAKFGTEAS